MTERTAVQNPILKYAQDLGWDIVSRADAESMRRFSAGGITTQEHARNASLFFDDILYR